jgi:hypothetical protein
MMECHFSKLPLELVLQIAEYLPTDSSYCLARTTKSLFHTPEMRRLGDLDTKWTISRRVRLLPLLAQDWSDKTFCAYCLKIHPRRDTPKVCKDWQRWSSCPRRTSGMWIHLDPWDYHLQFEDVYKFMENHRLGRDDMYPIALHTDWQVMDDKDMTALEYKKDQLMGNHKKSRKLEKRKDVNKGCLKKLDVVPLIFDNALILTTTQRMFYHAEQRDDLLNNGIGRHVFRPCSHWNWIPGTPGGDFWHRRMPSVEQLLNRVLSREWSPPPSKNYCCLYAESSIPTMCYYCATEYTLRVWNHGELGIELSLETWTKLGSGRSTLELWWLTAAHHTCDINDSDICRAISGVLPWKYPATGAPRFDSLFKQSTTAVLDPSFLRAFKDLCSNNSFTDSSAMQLGIHAPRPTGWRWKAWRRLLQKLKLARKRQPDTEYGAIARELWCKGSTR